jgi:integrase
VLARWTKRTPGRYSAFDGRLALERRRSLSSRWHARASFQARQLQHSTKTALLGDAKEVAEQWFLSLHATISAGGTVSGRALTKVVQAFIHYQETVQVPLGRVKPRRIQDYKNTLNRLAPFFGAQTIEETDHHTLERMALWRKREHNVGSSTLHHDLGLVRQSLKYALREQWISRLPQMPRLQSKPQSPDWFSPSEWKTLLSVSRQRIKLAEHTGNAASHIKLEREELHAFVLLMGHGCIRVDECLNLRWSDLTPDAANPKLPFLKQKVLIRIRAGKTRQRMGIGTFGVLAAMKMLESLHPNADAEDKLFATRHVRGMKTLLEAAQLRIDSQGRTRNMKTVRHTSLMFRFLYEPAIRPHELAIIGGTSALVLEQYYLRHLTAALVSKRLTQAALEAL